jgi:hypothetical protein
MGKTKPAGLIKAGRCRSSHLFSAYGQTWTGCHW